MIFTFVIQWVIRFMILAVCVWASDAGLAATAGFTQDGKTVFAIRFDPSNQLERVDLESDAVTQINVGLGKNDLVAGIAEVGNGEFYLVTKHALWRWKPGDSKAHWIEPAPEKSEFTDVACNPRNGDILIATMTPTEAGFCYKRKDDKQVHPVSIRYPPAHAIDCPVFLPDGSFLFGAYGDMWHGMIERTTEPPDPEGKWIRENLVAYRYAPMAQRETYDGTPIQTGITDITVSRKKAYVTFRRWGGSGWGSIQRLDLPTQNKGSWRSLNSFKDYVRSLDSVEEVAIMTGGWISLCSSSDGQKVFYRDGQIQKHFPIVDDKLIRGMRGK